MRRVASIIYLCAITLMCAPAAADAGIWRWIDELSGPGPYDGWQLEVRLVCFVPEGEKPMTRMVVGKSSCIIPLPSPHQRRISINVESGMLWSKDNPIDYGRPLSEDEKRVKVVPIQGMVYWEATRGLELGTGGGVFIFYSKHGLFDGFRRLVLEPMRVDVRPFEFVLTGDRGQSLFGKALRSITFRQSMVYMPKGVRAADFGSSIDGFATPREVLLSMSMVIDAEAFFR